MLTKYFTKFSVLERTLGHNCRKKIKLAADAEVNLQVISISDCRVHSQIGVIFSPVAFII